MIGALLLCMIPFEIDERAQGLIDAGTYYPGARVCESKPHPALMAMAQKHAKYQARWMRQGHQNWTKRKRELHKQIPGYLFKEICAQSWRSDRNKPLHEIGWSMFKAWAYHPTGGHWGVASTKHDLYGAGMALGRNGIWYACIIVGDK